MKAFFTICTLLLATAGDLWSQDTGALSGQIHNSRQEPLTGINVALEGTAFGAATGEDGTYLITGIPPGTYNLVVSSVGYEPARRQVTVRGGQTLTFSIAINESAQELQTVEIIGRRATTYKSDYSFAGTKLEARTVDIPQSISSVTKELLRDQGAYRLNEAVRNVAGVNQFSVYDDITMRGFRNADYRLINGMRMAANFWSSPLLVNVERVEFIKGPASALFGNANPGGTINMVTKKPLDETRRAIDFSVGSFNTVRTTADFTGPFNENKNLLYRLNIGYENAGSFRDQVFFRTTAVAPSITFLPTPRTRINFDMSYTDYHTVLDRGRPTFRDDEDLLSTPIDFNLNQPGDGLRDRIFYGILSVNQQLARGLDLNLAYMKFIDNQHLLEHGFNSYITDDSVGLYFTDRLRDHETDNITAYLSARFATGGIRHQALAGYDYNRYFDVNSEWWADEASVGGFSLVRPVYLNRQTSAYDAIYDEWSYYETEYANHGFYVQDLISWKRWQVLLGFRWDNYRVPANSWEFKGSGLAEADKQQAFLPRVGLVYNLFDHTNVYATFNQGYQPVDPFSNANPRFGGPFAPMYSQLLEAGVKGEYFRRRLLATVSVYQIEMNNVLVNANNPGNPDQLVQRGQERARGFEVEASGRILDNLSLQVSYAYNDAVISQSDDATQIGLVKENAPAHISGSWIRYTLNRGALSGLGLALGHSQVSERRTFDQYSDGRWLTLPGYLIFNGALTYQIDKYRMSLNVNNIANKTHWIGGYNFQRNWPGAPRNLLVSVGYTF